MQPSSIGVVGLGFAGTAAALLLRRAGHEVTVYEEAEQPGAAGAGIVLQPTGMAALAELELLSQAIARGARLSALSCVTPAGAPIVTLRYARLAEQLFGLGMHRGALFEILYEAALGAGVRVRLGSEIRSIDDSSELRVTDARGECHGPHDLLVVASGAQTRLRAAHLVKRCRPYPYGALWFVGQHHTADDGHTLRQVADGTRRFIGLLPTGFGPRANGCVPLVTLFWSLRMDSITAFRRDGLSRFKQRVRQLTREADFVLEQIHDIEQLLPSGYVDVVLRRPYAGRVVYIGDAAHAMSPQLGQGCNLGLVDAVTLAQVLAAEPGSLHDALPRYAALRRHQIAFYQFASRWLTPFFQSDKVWLGPFRDHGMRWASRLPFFERAMTTTMTGVRRGLLRAPLELAPLVRALPAAAK